MRIKNWLSAKLTMNIIRQYYILSLKKAYREPSALSVQFPDLWFASLPQLSLKRIAFSAFVTQLDVIVSSTCQ